MQQHGHKLARACLHTPSVYCTVTCACLPACSTAREGELEFDRLLASLSGIDQLTVERICQVGRRGRMLHLVPSMKRG